MGDTPSPSIDPLATRGLTRGARTRVALGLIVAALLLFLAWQGYRNPDFLLGLSAWRLC